MLKNMKKILAVTLGAALMMSSVAFAAADNSSPRYVYVNKSGVVYQYNYTDAHNNSAENTKLKNELKTAITNALKGYENYYVETMGGKFVKLGDGDTIDKMIGSATGTRPAACQAKYAVSIGTDGKMQTVEIGGGSAPVEVTGITLSPTTASVKVGETTKLTATVEPAGATDKTLKWTSSDTTKATVDNDGVVTGVAAGTVTITVATPDDKYPKTCEVTVTADPTEVEFALHVTKTGAKIGNVNLVINIEGVADLDEQQKYTVYYGGTTVNWSTVWNAFVIEVAENSGGEEYYRGQIGITAPETPEPPETPTVDVAESRMFEFDPANVMLYIKLQGDNSGSYTVTYVNDGDSIALTWNANMSMYTGKVPLVDGWGAADYCDFVTVE